MMGFANARTVAEEAVARAADVSEKHQPLFREAEPPTEYPVECLGSLRKATEAFAEITKAPIAICAQSVLASTCLVTAPHYDVELPAIGAVPITLYFLSKGTSGERKSTVDRMVNRAILDAEKEKRKEAGQVQYRWEAKKAAWTSRQDKIKKDNKDNPDNLEKELESLGPPPNEPVDECYIFEDITPQKLVMHLEKRPWAGIFTAEAASFIGGAAFRDDMVTYTVSVLNNFWGADPIRRSRVTTGSSHVYGCRGAMHLLVQPNLLDKILTNPMLVNTGFLGRILIADPLSTIGTREMTETPEWADKACKVHYDILKSFLSTTPKYGPTGIDVDVVKLTVGAAETFEEFYNWVETRYNNKHKNMPWIDLSCKLHEHAGRLAAVMACYKAKAKQIENPLITEEIMTDAIELAHYYLMEAERLRGHAIVAPVLRLAQKTLDWSRSDNKIIKWGDRVHLQHVYQNGPSEVRDAETARHIMEILESHQWFKRLEAGTEIDGKKRREAWEYIV